MASKQNQPPISLEFSSGSSSSSDCDEIMPRQRRVSTMPTTTIIPPPPPRQQPSYSASTSQELLKTAAALQWGRDMSSKVTATTTTTTRVSSHHIETRTSLSSPSVRQPSRDKWRRLARRHRRESATRNSVQQAPEDNSILDYRSDDDDVYNLTDEDEQDIVRSRIVKKAQVHAVLDGLQGRRLARRSTGSIPASQTTNTSADPFLDAAVLTEAVRKLTQRSTTMSSPTRSPGNAIVPRKLNSIKLHIYDLISQDTLMQLPWGCVCEIGKCFNDVNSALHELGTGAYHVGVEVNGVEFAFGSTNMPRKSGVFSCIPKCSPGYQYRTTIDFGEDRVIRRKRWTAYQKMNTVGKFVSAFKQIEECVDGRQIIKEMQVDYMGKDYDILRKNCCTFARDACIRLGIEEEEIPSWFGNLAESGAITQDFAAATVEPLARVLSSPLSNASTFTGFTDTPSLTHDPNNSVSFCTDYYEVTSDGGYEIIAERNAKGTKDLVYVIDTEYSRAHSEIDFPSMKRMSTFA